MKEDQTGAQSQPCVAREPISRADTAPQPSAARRGLSLAEIHAGVQPIPVETYFREKAATGPALKPLGKPCHDCAVVWGLYTEVSDALARQPADVRDAASLRWFCHNHPGRACRGNIDNCAAIAGAARP